MLEMKEWNYYFLMPVGAELNLQTWAKYVLLKATAKKFQLLTNNRDRQLRYCWFADSVTYI